MGCRDRAKALIPLSGGKKDLRSAEPAPWDPLSPHPAVAMTDTTGPAGGRSPRNSARSLNKVRKGELLPVTRTPNEIQPPEGGHSEKNLSPGCVRAVGKLRDNSPSQVCPLAPRVTGWWGWGGQGEQKFLKTSD